MALPTSTTTPSTNTLWVQLQRYLTQIKTDWIVIRDAMAAGDTPGSNIELLGQQASVGIGYVLDAQAAGTDFVNHVREMVRDPVLGVAADLTGLLTTQQDLATYLESTAPKDGSGFWATTHKYTLDVNDRWIYEQRLFTPAQTAGIRTRIDAILAYVA